MTVQPGATLLHYRIGEKLGQGGMGEVWKATDTTLDREVAIKILPEDFAEQADRLARFEREAKALAALNHPAIASVFGLHETAGVRFLAMELAPGEELSRLIQRGPVPLDDALRISSEIAAALEAAHETGIIHRDLKPANVMVNSDGGVKVLDFGLAKSFDAEPGDSSASMTLTTPATRAGVIMGTAAYMSPEQARGKAVDKRADIWSFGVVLWEMLTGRHAFQGETVSDTLASVLKESPDMEVLPAGLPPAVRRLVARCLEKDPKLRLRDIGEARILLTGGSTTTGEMPGASTVGATVEGSRSTGPNRLSAVFLAVAGLVVGLVAGWQLLGTPQEITEAPSLHLSIPLPLDRPAGQRLSRPVAISPTGDRVAYVGVSSEGRNVISTRPLDRMEFEVLPQGGEGLDPFFSPDGRSLGFLNRDNFQIMRIDFDAMVRATGLGVNALVGAIWGEDGFIYYTPAPASEQSNSIPVHRLSLADGSSTAVTELVPETAEFHMWPELLPGGKTLLYAVVRNFDFSAAEIRAIDLEGGQEKTLLPNGQLARYLRSGHLVYLQGDTLLAARFDPDRVELSGTPKAVLSGVMTNPDSGSAAFSVSRDGTLIYLPAISGSARATIVGYDREGNSRPLIAEAADYLTGRVSPDGTRVVVQVQEGPGQSSVRVHDIARRTVTRLTRSAGLHLAPIWSPDGRWIYYVHLNGGSASMKRMPSDGSAPPEELQVVEGFAGPSDVSADGKWVLCQDSNGASGDLILIPVDGSEDSRPYLATEANEVQARVSPDGRFAAYVDNSMGRNEVFLRTFPEPGGSWRISTAGGLGPAWSPDGREILYFQGADLMSVRLGSGDEPRPGRPEKLFSLPRSQVIQVGLRQPAMDLLPDGTILVIQPDGEVQVSRQVHVITNWHQRLRELIP